MPVWRCVTALAAAVGLEGLALLAALHGVWAPALALHAASSGCAAGSLHRRLLAGPPVWSFALVFASTLFLPILGALGTAAVALAASRAPSSPEPEVVRTRIAGPPRIATKGEEASSEREARLDGREGRQALLERNDPVAIARLWLGLEDPEEDVRLLAHSLLESKSRTAESHIHDLEGELEPAPGTQWAAIHRRLAHAHWELARLGLVRGECLDHAVETARFHARLALEGEPGSAHLHFLLGRIELRRGRPKEAAAALFRAAELGLPAALVRPYLAEAAFLARRFDLVRRSLAGAYPGETLDRIRRHWA